MYYVYEWYIIETNEIIYVGKGINKRYKVRKRNNLFNEFIKRYKCDSRIVRYFDNEKEAFNFEFEYINLLKEKGQCVCNIHKGGAGGSGEYWTQELREEYSKNNVMKSQTQRERMSKNNPMRNKEVAKRVAQKKSKPVIIGDKEFNSVKDAAQYYNAYTETIILWCKKGITRYGEKARYKNCEQVEYKGKRYNKGGCRELTYKDKIYETPKDLAEELNISVYKIYRWIKKGHDYDGNICHYNS